jgi:hypothetical protein
MKIGMDNNLLHNIKTLTRLLKLLNWMQQKPKQTELSNNSVIGPAPQYLSIWNYKGIKTGYPSSALPQVASRMWIE